MKIRIYFLVKIMAVVFVFAVFACQTGSRPLAVFPVEELPQGILPEPVPLEITPDIQEPEAGTPEAPGDSSGEEKVFDPASITPEMFQATKIDVQHFIGELNRIIRAKDFHTWTSNLDDSYFEAISSPAFLQQRSGSSFLQSRSIVLKTPLDYFLQVVVPSRANSHVDDIEFISPTRVKAYTLSSGGQRLRLYDLEHSGGKWKIIN